MSKLNIDQKSIRALLSDEHADFLIPDYQRPYAWGEDECSTLWDDLFAFAFPNDDCDQFSKDNEYFLGPIVTFKNDDDKQEIIDGQQRLTTIMLLLRAFYDSFANMKDKNSKSVRKAIAACIWKTDEFDEPDTSQLKIDSEVASDNDKDEFLQILKTGKADPRWKSNYARNFRFFEKKVDELVHSWPTYEALFATRIIRYVILLPIEAESQDTALRIFSTLNDRGLPLSDADIFKSQFYKHFSNEGKKDEFVARWKRMEAGANELFHPLRGTPMDELFTRTCTSDARARESRTPPRRASEISTRRINMRSCARTTRSAIWRACSPSGSGLRLATDSRRRPTGASPSCASPPTACGPISRACGSSPTETRKGIWTTAGS